VILIAKFAIKFAEKDFKKLSFERLDQIEENFEQNFDHQY
jgi:hypothetical protein